MFRLAFPFVMKNVFALILSIVVCYSCQTKESEIPSFSVDVSGDSQVCLSEIAEKVEIVRLETTDESLIGEIYCVGILNTTPNPTLYIGTFKEGRSL